MLTALFLQLYTPITYYNINTGKKQIIKQMDLKAATGSVAAVWSLYLPVQPKNIYYPYTNTGTAHRGVGDWRFHQSGTLLWVEGQSHGEIGQMSKETEWEALG